MVTITANIGKETKTETGDSMFAIVLEHDTKKRTTPSQWKSFRSYERYPNHNSRNPLRTV